MKTFIAKVVVKLKPSIADIKGQTLKCAVESIFPVQNLICRVGTSYSFEFDAKNQVEALNLINQIVKNLLCNDIAEHYEIRSLEEV